MVMSGENSLVEREEETTKTEEEEQDSAKVSDKEKDLAAEASSAYNTGDYKGCMLALEKLEILRPTDLVLAYNKIVVQCKESQASQGVEGSSPPVALSDVVTQLESVAMALGVSLSGSQESETVNTVLLYNLALARFQQRHVLQASQLAARLLPLSPSLSPAFARKILFFQCELSLALHQPEQALAHVVALEERTDTERSQDNEVNLEQARLFVLRARCNVMARLTKTLKKELKSVSLPGTLGHTCEFVRSHIEALHGNHRKSIKMLNSVVQMAGNRVFPHYYNNLGCLHQIMKKPNLAVYYFKCALDKMEAGETSGQSTSWVTQSQVLYNIGISLLHARRPSVAFEFLVEVVGAHYLDPHVWYHLAECIIAHHYHNSGLARDTTVTQTGVGAGMSHKIVASNPGLEQVGSSKTGTAASLSMEFAYVCLKNAESLLPANSGEENTGVFCEGVGYIGNPVTWSELEQLRVAIIACKTFTALAVEDYIPALHYAEQLLQSSPLPSYYSLLGHLYAAESLILQDRMTEAMAHLDPEILSSGWESVSKTSSGQDWQPNTLDTARQVVQYNLAVGFALREEWEKVTSLLGQLYSDSQDVSAQVLLLVLYSALRQGQEDKARRIVRDRCPTVSLNQPPDKFEN